MSWTDNVSVPMTYENGVYRVTAAPYKRKKMLSREEYRERILQYLAVHPGVTQTTMGRKIGVRWHTINPILSELVEDGIIYKEFSDSHLKGEGSRYYLINHT